MAKQKRFATHITAVNGKRVYLSAGSKEELEKKILQAQIERNAGVDISDVTTFAEYADLWLRVYKSPPKIRESSHKIVAANLRNHVLPFFGSMRLREIKPMHIQMFLTSLGDTSKSLQAKCFQIVKGVLASAADNGLIAKSPVSSTDKAGGRPTKEMKPLTAKQSKELLENLEGKRPYAFVLIALSTGMRRGEILGLMWEDVDLDSNLIHVRHNLTFPCDSNHAAVSTVLKTTSSRRDVPITPALKEFLLNEERTSPYVIHMQDGEVLSKSSFRAMWRTVNAARPSGVEDCHPHLLRHTFTTRCISSGMDPTSVQHLLGHKDLSVTMGIYNHYLEEERHENTVQLLHGALAYLC